MLCGLNCFQITWFGSSIGTWTDRDFCERKQEPEVTPFPPQNLSQQPPHANNLYSPHAQALSKISGAPYSCNSPLFLHLTILAISTTIISNAWTIYPCGSSRRSSSLAICSLQLGTYNVNQVIRLLLAQQPSRPSVTNVAIIRQNNILLDLISSLLVFPL